MKGVQKVKKQRSSEEGGRIFAEERALELGLESQAGFIKTGRRGKRVCTGFQAFQKQKKWK